MAGPITMRVRGFSLVELMVALTISLIILAAVSVMFVNTRRAYDTQDRLARVQENGRFAMLYLMQDIRTTGYLGCQTGQISSNPAKFQNMLDPGNGGTGYAFTLGIPIEGFEGGDTTNSIATSTTWSPSGNNQFPVGAAAGANSPDMLTIRTVDPTSIRYLTAPLSNAQTDDLPVNDVSVFNVNDIVAVTDCNALDLMQVTGIQTTPPRIQHNIGGAFVPGNATNRLSRAYGMPDDTISTLRAVKIYRYTTRRYYIAPNPNQIPSLYMDINGRPPIELVEGIENLQILYGIDTDGTTPGTFADDAPNIYLTANAVAYWDRVVSLRIGILARTPNATDSSDSGARTYDVNGFTVTAPAGDRNQRRVFLTTVKLRDFTLMP